MLKPRAGQPAFRLRVKTLRPSKRPPAEGPDHTAAGADTGFVVVAPMGASTAGAHPADQSHNPSDSRPPWLAASFRTNFDFGVCSFVRYRNLTRPARRLGGLTCFVMVDGARHNES
jgi:hypothetical protein